MNLAKISANCQVTVPAEIRRRLQLKAGDKLIFIEREGHIVIDNASATAILLRAYRARDIHHPRLWQIREISRYGTDKTAPNPLKYVLPACLRRYEALLPE